jgi:hypothetical protein
MTQDVRQLTFEDRQAQRVKVGLGQVPVARGLREHRAHAQDQRAADLVDREEQRGELVLDRRARGDEALEEHLQEGLLLGLFTGRRQILKQEVQGSEGHTKYDVGSSFSIMYMKRRPTWRRQLASTMRSQEWPPIWIKYDQS